MNKCKNCPAKDQDRSCLAQLTWHERYCQLVDPASPIHDPRWITKLAADPECPERPPATTIPVAETLGLIVRMKACRSWQASSSCGCSVNLCLEGKGKDGRVTHADCFDCLRSTSLPSSPAGP